MVAREEGLGLVKDEAVVLYNMTKEKDLKKIFQEYHDYAEENGFHLNPDQNITNSLLRSLLEREKKYGKRYCPCRRIKESEEENNKIVCPCVYHKKEIEEDGHCHCLLFVK